MKILIVDDHQIVRIGLSVLLRRKFPDVVIEELTDSGQIIDKLKNSSYDLVITDVHMSQSMTTQLVKNILNLFPESRIIIYSYLSDEIYGLHFLKAGCKAYVNKKSQDNEIEKAIDYVLNGRRYINKNLVVQFENLLIDNNKAPVNKLSERESEILNFLMQGLSLVEISKQMSLQPSTISTYKNRIFEKFNTSNLLEINKVINFIE